MFIAVKDAKLPSANAARIDAANQNWRLLFDAATSQSAIWQFLMPQDYGSALVLRLLFSNVSLQSGTNSAVWRAYLAAITPGDVQAASSKSFASANSATIACVNNQPADNVVGGTITMTNADSVAAGDFVMLKIDRDAANGSDTMTGDAALVGVLLEYTQA